MTGMHQWTNTSGYVWLSLLGDVYATSLLGTRYDSILLKVNLSIRRYYVDNVEGDTQDFYYVAVTDR